MKWNNWPLNLLRRLLVGDVQGGNPARLSTETVNPPLRLPNTHQEAAQRLTDWSTIKTVDHKNKRVKTNRDGSHPLIIEFYRMLSKELERRGYPFYAFEFARSADRQARLLKQGVTLAKPGSSPHNWGCAVDVVHSKRFWDLSNKEWAVIGAIGKEVARRRKIPITWGGDWSFYDPAHWEITHWRDLRTAYRELLAEGTDLPEADGLRFAMLENRAKSKRS